MRFNIILWVCLIGGILFWVDYEIKRKAFCDLKENQITVTVMDKIFDEEEAHWDYMTDSYDVGSKTFMFSVRHNGINYIMETQSHRYVNTEIGNKITISKCKIE